MTEEEANKFYYDMPWIVRPSDHKDINLIVWERVYQAFKERLMLECSLVPRWTVEEFEAWKEKMVVK